VSGRLKVSGSDQTEVSRSRKWMNHYSFPSIKKKSLKTLPGKFKTPLVNTLIVVLWIV